MTTNYFLGIQTPSSPTHSPFKFEGFEDAKTAVHASISKGFFNRDDKAFILTGPGTIYNIVEEEFVGKGIPLHENGEILVVQMPQSVLDEKGVFHHSLMQLVLSFETPEGAVEAVKSALETSEPRILNHVSQGGHVITYIHMCPGMLFMRMGSNEFIQKQRDALMAQMRAQGRTPSGVVMPGSS